VKEHEFFQELNWKDLENLHVEPPYVPQVTSEDDASNFANFVQDQNQGLDTGKAVEAERSDGEAVVGEAVIGPEERDDNQIRRLSSADDELFRDF